MYIQMDEDDRIISTTAFKEYASDEMIEFSLPDDFDFSKQSDYRIVDGELVYDPLPEDPKVQISELEMKLKQTDYISSKAMDALLRGDGTFEEIAEEYSEVLVKRQEWRDEINKLGGEKNDVVASILNN